MRLVMTRLLSKRRSAGTVLQIDGLRRNGTTAQSQNESQAITLIDSTIEP
jgi:hypothetical protein